MEKQKRKLKSAFRAAILCFVDLVFPKQCLSCAKEGFALCFACSKKILTRQRLACPFCEKKTFFGETCDTCSKTKSLDGVVSFCPYSNTIARETIKIWKYEGVKEDIEIAIARIIREGFLKAKENSRSEAKKIIREQVSDKNLIKQIQKMPLFFKEEKTFLQPIPLHKKREKQRGFNQSKWIAEQISKQSASFEISDVLERTKKTYPQAELDEYDRARNVAGAFSCKNAEVVKDGNFVLVDDVITTGNTIEECAKELKKNKAKSVWAITLLYGKPK